MTTPTPNERDKEVALKTFVELQVALGKERSESQRFLQRLGETVIERDHLKERISTLEAALAKAEKAITFRPPWFGNSELVLKGRLDEEALDAIREAKEG